MGFSMGLEICVQISLRRGFGGKNAGVTIGNKAYVFAPYDGMIRVFAPATEPNIDLLKGCISAQKLSLGFAQRVACFDQVDLLDS